MLPKSKLVDPQIGTAWHILQRDADDAHYQAEHQRAYKEWEAATLKAEQLIKEQAVIAERKRIGEWLEMADADMNFQDVIDALKSGQSIDG